MEGIVNLELNTFYVILNTGIIIRQRIEKYKLLCDQSNNALNNIKIIANGTGIHWPELDEDLSLKGLLFEYFFTTILPPGAGETSFAMSA